LLSAAAAAAFPRFPAAAALEDPLLRDVLRGVSRRPPALIEWEGEATVHDDEREILLGVATAVAPFDWARSASWVRTQGMAAERIMLIRPDGGWTQSDGNWTAMAAPAVAHERAQFALYGLMLLSPLIDPGAAVSRLPDRGGLRGLAVSHPKAPPTQLWFDSANRLREARNTVPDPEAGAPVAQLFRFSAETVAGYPKWPRRLSIEQNGEPYFDLAFTRFRAVARGAPAPPIPTGSAVPGA
jgi:hypothetical protein